MLSPYRIQHNSGAAQACHQCSGHHFILVWYECQSCQTGSVLYKRLQLLSPAISSSGSHNHMQLHHTHHKMFHFSKRHPQLCLHGPVLPQTAETSSTEALDSFPVTSLVRVVDLIMWTPLLGHLPIIPHLFRQLCLLSSSLGPLGPAMRVCLAFGFFVIVRQSKLVHTMAHHFNPSWHTCRGDILVAPPDVLLITRWSTTIQAVGTTSC